jgi:hypothetical protein
LVPPFHFLSFLFSFLTPWHMVPYFYNYLVPWPYLTQVTFHFFCHSIFCTCSHIFPNKLISINTNNDNTSKYNHYHKNWVTKKLRIQKGFDLLLPLTILPVNRIMDVIVAKARANICCSISSKTLHSLSRFCDKRYSSGLPLMLNLSGLLLKLFW